MLEVLKPFEVVCRMERVEPWVTAFARISGALESDMWRPRQYFGVLATLSVSGSVDLFF